MTLAVLSHPSTTEDWEKLLAFSKLVHPKDSPELFVRLYKERPELGPENHAMLLEEGEILATASLLPHRPPFLFVDELTELVPGERAKGRWTLHGDEWFFPGHFPGRPTLPGVLMCEAIAQSFSQIGLKVDIAAMPYAVLIGRVANQEFSAWTLGTGAVTGDSLQPLTSLVHTQDKKSGAGANNYGHYSNKEIDSLIDKAARSLDEHAREDLQKTAAKAAIDDGAIVPLVNIRAAWAFRKGLTIKPRADGMTLAMSIRERAK